ncbi:MAG: asparagine synthase (glutamine-hydrolyzing) [Rhodospirillaceae bacterium]|nr:asparagine synthase (glutamine-hydrolyzing) [Rhodospirillaceae bacterium]
MCGIAGIISNSSSPPDESCLEYMEKALAHRGPDGSGRYRSGVCAMVHTRLAIVDLETGDQPFVNTDNDGKEVALVANGEIYNNPELRSHMTDTVFKTKSDCEPPLFLYMEHGADFTQKLRGMYAIAIWDEVNDRLVLARDAFGIKPLYYAETEKGFVFASEPSAIIKSGLVAAELNCDARDELLQLQFITGRKTAFLGINRVLPGETLIVENGKIIERRIAKALPAGGPKGIPKGKALFKLDSVLNDSIKVHQRADVPYGMFLSGGIDSSTLLAIMSRLNPNPVVAFTAGFPGTDVADERALARKLAKSEGAEHIEVDFDADDMWELLPSIASHMDDPAADYALLPTWKLAAVAKKNGIKVVLTGEGGDELFGGYGRYRTARRILFRKDMYRKGMLENANVLIKIDKTRKWRQGMEAAAIDAASPERTRLQQVQAQDVATWLPADLLGKVDRMLMAHGVEGRVPFLDPEMADFAFLLPDGLKVRRGLGHGLGKWILRKWLETAMPEAQAFSRKRGFSVPVGGWMSQRGQDLARAVANQPGIAEICRPDAVKDIFSNSRPETVKARWSLLFYAVWHQVHIVGSDPKGSVFDII